MRVRVRRLGSILALLAATVFALLPLLHGAAVAESGSDLIEVCTAQGSKWVPAADIGLPGPAADQHAGNPCPNCVPAFTGLVPSVPFAWFIAPLAPGEKPVRTVEQAPLPEQPAAAAQPRAPPTFAS